jgi:quercetin dioxygenase-like cupin family protein
LVTRSRTVGANSPASQPHTHPDERTYTIISGTWYVGFGDKFDESKLIPLTAGSFYIEPAGVPHFIMVKDEGTMVKITGTGPSRLIPVQPK